MLDAAPLASFDTFPLRRRFLDPTTGEIARHFAGRVAPVTAAGAATLADASAQRCARPGEPGITFRSDDAPGLVHRRLRQLPIADDATIIVSWDRSTAVVTEWSIFADYWDDFCYPASDDVSIWPADGAWMLSYRRYEVLQFSRGRPAD